MQKQARKIKANSKKYEILIKMSHDTLTNIHLENQEFTKMQIYKVKTRRIMKKLLNTTQLPKIYE